MGVRGLEYIMEKGNENSNVIFNSDLMASKKYLFKVAQKGSDARLPNPEE